MGQDIALVISVPCCPDSDLSPNAHVGWRRKAGAVAMARHLTGAATRNAIYAQLIKGNLVIGEPAVPKLRLDATIYWGKGRKSVDDDNAWGMLKAYRDGVADGLDRSDRDFVSGSLEQKRDKDGQGYVEIVLTEAA